MKKLARKINQIYHTRGYRNSYNKAGIDIFSKDWDNLIILDACRYDRFKELSNFSHYDYVYSCGSTTPEFLIGNFGNREINNTIYISANGFTELLYDNLNLEVFKLVNMWGDEYWDEKYNTVLPKTIEEEAITIAEEYPHKRLIVHYIQPHCPFIGDIASKVEKKFERHDIWESLFTREIEIEDSVLMSAYDETLTVALDSVYRLISHLDGKCVVTGDHGQLIGETSSPIPITEYGHPRGTYIDKLVKVPWVELNEGDRKVISAGDKSNGYRKKEAAKERLEDMGYSL